MTPTVTSIVKKIEGFGSGLGAANSSTGAGTFFIAVGSDLNRYENVHLRTYECHELDVSVKIVENLINLSNLKIKIRLHNNSNVNIPISFLRISHSVQCRLGTHRIFRNR